MFDIFVILFQDLLEQGHILDLIGVGTPGASAVYFYFTRKEAKEKKAEIKMWKAEADKYQGKWIEAVEKLADEN